MNTSTMNPLALSTLLPPLQNAIALRSWEDVEDIASELKRLARLKRLSELQAIQEQLVLRNETKIAPEVSQVANQPPVAFRPEPEITLDTTFDEKGHAESWRNQLAYDLNYILGRAEFHLETTNDDSDQEFATVVLSLAKRVAEFEEIKVLP